MALTFGLHADAALTTLAVGKQQISIDDQALFSADRILYFGSRHADRKLGARAGNVSISCSAPPGIDALISTSGLPGSWANTIYLGQWVMGGAAMAIPIHLRISITDIGAITGSITVDLSTAELLEYTA